METRTKILMLKAAVTKKVPVYVQFAVSNKCNLRCSMCNALDSRKHERELGLSEIGRLADILKELNVAILILTGGEPLIRADLAEIVGLFTERGIEVRMQTNAILASEEKIEGLIRAGLKEVTISLDSLDPERYDAITGVAGSWHKIIRGIALFSRYLPKKGNMSGINAVVSRRNMEEIPVIIEFVTRIGFYCSLIPVHVSDAEDEFIVRKKSPGFDFKPEEYAGVDKLYETIITMKRKGFKVHNSYRFLRESREFLKGNKVNWRCASPFLYFSISPGGNFLPCVDISTSISMLEGNFIERFRGQEFIKSVRERVKKCRGCMYACYPEVSFFCYDPRVFMERLTQGLMIFSSERKAFTYEELLAIIEEIKQKYAG